MTVETINIDTMATRLAQLLVADVGRGEGAGLSDEALQELLTAVVRVYSARAQARREDGETAPSPFRPESGVSATDVVVTAAAMLQAEKIAAFELAMWHY